MDSRPVVSLYRNGRRLDAEVHVWSVARSVASALVGLAIEDGLLGGLDPTLAELLPEHRAEMSSDEAWITLRQLMTMTAGFPYERGDPTPIADTLAADGDAVSFVFAHELADPPGTRFAYSNVAAHLVTAVLDAALERADGENPRSVLQYAEERLFTPLESTPATRSSDRCVSREPRPSSGRGSAGAPIGRASTPAAAPCGSPRPTRSSSASCTSTTAPGAAARSSRGIG